MRSLKTLCFTLSLFFTATSLFAAGSIINEGDTPVQISGKSASGIMGGGTIPPGQSIPMRQTFMWVKHVPTRADEKVRIRIVEGDGTTGYITSSGGIYNCAGSAGQPQNTVPVRPATSLRQGYVTNNSNAAIYVTTVRRGGEQKTSTVMTSQTIPIPEDTVEVQTSLLNSSFGDVQVSIAVVMPDGKYYPIRSAKGLVRLS